MKRALLTGTIALAAMLSAALFTTVTPKASAGGALIFPCYNCKFGFNWLDSDSTSGVLQVSPRCRAGRRLALYGTPIGVSSGVVSRLDRTTSTRQGNWELSWTGTRTILVVQLARKVVRGRVCKGASVAFIGAV